jgi:hypothetical protein
MLKVSRAEKSYAAREPKRVMRRFALSAWGLLEDLLGKRYFHDNWSVFLMVITTDKARIWARYNFYPPWFSEKTFDFCNFARVL